MIHRIASRQIQALTKIKIKRSLSTPGNILVKSGQAVTPTDVIGQAKLPGKFVIIDVARALGHKNLDITEIMLKNENDNIEEGEIIAQVDGRFPFQRRKCKSPVSGKIITIANNRIFVETEAQIETVNALVSGEVTKVDHTQGVIIETTGTYIEAACCLGGEIHGLLKLASNNPRANLDSDSLSVLERQAIFMAGGTLDEDTIRQAEQIGAAGLIVGSFDARLLELDPPPQISIVATEGFGKRPMNPETFEILQTAQNNPLSIQLGEPARHPLITKNPKIIIPLSPSTGDQLEVPPNGQASTQSLVRTLRNPDMLEWGEIIATPLASQTIETQQTYSGAEVKFAYDTHFVPWLNLEHLA